MATMRFRIKGKKAISYLIILSIDIAAILTWSIVIALSIPFLFINHRFKVRKKKKPSIVRGPLPIINIKYNSKADRLYGYRSDTIVYGIYPVYKKDDFDYVFSLGSYNRLRLFIPYIIFIWIIWNYDIFHLFFSGGFLADTPLKWLELPLLKLLGKKIIVSPFGSDAFVPSKSKNKYNLLDAYIRDGYKVDEKKTQNNINYLSKYADYIIAAGSFIDYIPYWNVSFHAGLLDLDKWQPFYCIGSKEKVKIVHAPNHRTLKGTEHLIAACDQLKKEGHQIELVLVEKKPNEEAKRIYEAADIIADQFIGGEYGLFAIEAMALGKPVLCYLREDLFKYHKAWSEIPIINANPENIKGNLLKLIENPELRLELGRRGRAFVEKYHSYQYMGSVFDKIYRKLWFGEDGEIDV